MEAKGTNHLIEYIFRYIDKDRKDDLHLFAEEATQRTYLTFNSADEVAEILGEMVYNYINRLSFKELNDLRYYTGTSFKFINNVMRRKWNYEENGLLTKEKEEYYRSIGERITRVVRKFPSLNMNVKAYRGVSLRAFYDYGIYTLEDLIHLEGNYIYESGFTSTSIVRTSSFFKDYNKVTDNCNIELEYLIAKECQDGALLLSDVISYSKSQVEFLLNSDSLSKVNKVEIDKETNTARITLTLIPRMIWEPEAIEHELATGEKTL